jgi:hypothetical protein
LKELIIYQIYISVCSSWPFLLTASSSISWITVSLSVFAKRIAIDASDLLAGPALLVLGKSVTPKAKGCAWLLSL